MFNLIKKRDDDELVKFHQHLNFMLHSGELQHEALVTGFWMPFRYFIPHFSDIFPLKSNKMV